MAQTRLLIVSHQDPGHMTGGQGVALLNIAREAALLTGHPVSFISLRLSGEAPEEKFDNGSVAVTRLSVNDSEQISTPYQGSEEEQYERRMEFNRLALSHIRTHYPPHTFMVHLNGFYSVPLLAKDLPDYESMSLYHLILSRRLEHTREGDRFYERLVELERASFEANKRIQVPSPGSKDEVLSFFAEAEQVQIAEKVCVIPNGTEDEFFDTPVLGERRKNRVLAWGRIAPEKGFEYLIEAMKHLPDAELLLFGRVDDGERKRGQYREKLEELSSGCANIRLDFRADGIRDKERIALIDSASVVVVPSLYEPFGMVITEAMARGKPVLTTATAGGLFIMNTDKTGFGEYGYVAALSSTKPNIPEFVDAIDRLLNDAPLYEKISRAVRKRASDFRWSDVTANILRTMGWAPKH